jgi:apoptosis-stimulating of p53 protein 1
VKTSLVSAKQHIQYVARLVYRTPLHCAASCNNLAMVRFLVEHGACIFATTLSDHETAAEKCEEDEEGFDGCSEYLYSK